MNNTQSIKIATRFRDRQKSGRRNRRNGMNVTAHILTGLAALIALALLVYLLLFLLVKGVGVISWDFLTQPPAAVGEPGGGIVTSLLGTATIVGIASLLGVPLGIMIGTFLSERATNNSIFSTVARIAVNTFTGIPSIIVGIFVYVTVVKPMGNFSAIAGGIALAIVMIPIIARTSEDVLRLVPGSIREAGLALGIPTWRVTLGLVLPAARAGIITGGVLAVARVAGETAPLILTALGNEFLPSDFLAGLSQPTDEVTLRILKYARGPYETWHAQAYGAAFVLVIAVATGALLLRLTTRGRGIKIQ
jgi:phosphate transport system permease protein